MPNVLNYLARAKPRVVLYDVLFTEHDRTKFFVGDDEWSGAESDEELATSARALSRWCCQVMRYQKRSRAAVFRADPAPAGRHGSSASHAEERPVFVPPIAPIAAASRAVAHNYMVADPDGPWRRYVPFMRNHGSTIPSLAVATASVALDLAGRRIHSDDRGLWVGNRLLPLATGAIRLTDGSRSTAVGC